MTKEEAYQMALMMDEEERTAFKDFLSDLLKDEEAALLSVNTHQE